MSSISGVDHRYTDYSSQPRGFLTPPPTWRARRSSPVLPGSEKKPRRSTQSKADLFHVIHKVPAGDSPYVRAKHVQLVDKDPSRAVSLFWSAINAGDRVDSALKDMAVVMKQLDRSDEAIEAIKSFRHLCPAESQESLDNVLVELYKQSGRIEEEIEMLKVKLKQVEEGIAFGGKRTKMARSQGKKIHITVEKEYSRLLGNLAWAYMQQKDFKSAEEHYRKALTFKSDKNKQCNLAVCLMHMNKLTEAKFLLQATRVSSDNGRMDESYAKSYERASQMLAELELQHGRKPMKQMEPNNEYGRGFGGQWDKGHCFEKYCNDKDGLWPSPPLTFSVNQKSNGALTEFSHEKRANIDWRINHYHYNIGQEAYSARKRPYESPFCNRIIPKIPFTQPQRCSWYGDQGKDGMAENAYGNSCRKLSFESSTDSENMQSLVNQNVNYASTVPAEIPRVSPQISEKYLPSMSGDWQKCSSHNLNGSSGNVEPSQTNEERMNSLAHDCEKSATEECELPSDSAYYAECAETKELYVRDSGRCCKLISAMTLGPSDIKAVGTLDQQTCVGKPCEISECDHKRSWADMVEEDEQALESWRNDFPENFSGNLSQESLFSFQTPGKISVGSMYQNRFNDENVDSNIISETPKLLDQAEKLSQKIEMIDLGSGYFTQPEKAASVRRSLCFGQTQNLDQETEPLTIKVLNFEGQSLTLSEDSSATKSVKRRNRLQVFQDITCSRKS